ncbi:hypothetical protein RhiirA5_432666 [Rhizophagus irregularis]|uniref:Uncharacterized protein n=1 Tax=Rhizophagus irregularis TaxID=588596 RepID=A0A2N0NSX5_9GLOM|nr:hypothetical protein RhiirA5_432666 [Rhizophagus irregularis]
MVIIVTLKNHFPTPFVVLVIAKLNGTEVLTRKTITPSDLSNEKEGEDVDDVEIDYEDSNLEEIKVQILVKSNNIKVPTAKTLNIEPIRYKKVMEKISSIVQKTLKKKVKSKDYTISYKAVNAYGPSNELEDESDFQEFISDVLMKVKFLQYTKKKKSCAIREEDLSKEERERSKVISTLCKMYKCNIHITPCFIQDNQHLQLNPARLQ